MSPEGIGFYYGYYQQASAAPLRMVLLILLLQHSGICCSGQRPHSLAMTPLLRPYVLRCEFGTSLSHFGSTATCLHISSSRLPAGLANSYSHPAVDGLPHPALDAHPALRTLLDRVRRMARDAITMPVLGRYVTGYHRRLAAVRHAGRALADAQSTFNGVIDRFALDFGNRCDSPDYYDELLDAFAEVAALSHN